MFGPMRAVLKVRAVALHVAAIWCASQQRVVLNSKLDGLALASLRLSHQPHLRAPVPLNFVAVSYHLLQLPAPLLAVQKHQDRPLSVHLPSLKVC